MTARTPIDRALTRGAAAAVVVSMPVIAAAMGHLTWTSMRGFDPRAATLGDLALVAAAMVGAICSSSLVACSLPLIIAPLHSRARRAAVAVAPVAWRRIIAVALSGSAAAGLAIPAAASSDAAAERGVPDPIASGISAHPSGHRGGNHAEAGSDAGWIAVDPPMETHAGWLDDTDAATGDSPLARISSGPHQRSAQAPMPRTEHRMEDDDALRTDPPSAPRAAHAEPEDIASRTHVVVAGESLWSITRDAIDGPAAAVAAAWPDLYEANAGTVGADPSMIHPGDELTLPAEWSR